jgi:hypothetical protein
MSSEFKKAKVSVEKRRENERRLQAYLRGVGRRTR